MKAISGIAFLLLTTTAAYAQSAPKPETASAPVAVQAPPAPAIAPAAPITLPATATAVTTAPSCADSASPTKNEAEFQKLLTCYQTLRQAHEQLGEQIRAMPKGTYENSIALAKEMKLSLDLIQVNQAISESDDLYPPLVKPTLANKSAVTRPSIPNNVQSADEGKAPVVQAGAGVAENPTTPTVIPE